MTGAVLDFAATVQGAFYRHQANEQRLELLQTMTQALAASFEVAQRLHTAGNITDLDLARERAVFEEAKVQLRAAERRGPPEPGALNTLMGLWGQQTTWQIDRRLPDLPAQALPFADLERPALQQSLALASARQRIVAGEQVGVTRATALIPEASLGPKQSGRRQMERWTYGPFPHPLSIQGQARVGRAVTELRRAQQEYRAGRADSRHGPCGVRTIAGGAGPRPVLSRYPAAPAGRIVNEAQLHYNAMQLGVIDLLRPGSNRYRPPSPLLTRCWTTG